MRRYIAFALPPLCAVGLQWAMGGAPSRKAAEAAGSRVDARRDDARRFAADGALRAVAHLPAALFALAFTSEVILLMNHQLDHNSPTNIEQRVVTYIDDLVMVRAPLTAIAARDPRCCSRRVARTPRPASGH